MRNIHVAGFVLWEHYCSYVLVDFFVFVHFSHYCPTTASTQHLIQEPNMFSCRFIHLHNKQATLTVLLVYTHLRKSRKCLLISIFIHLPFAQQQNIPGTRKSIIRPNGFLCRSNQLSYLCYKQSYSYESSLLSDVSV